MALTRRNSRPPVILYLPGVGAPTLAPGGDSHVVVLEEGCAPEEAICFEADLLVAPLDRVEECLRISSAMPLIAYSELPAMMERWSFIERSALNCIVVPRLLAEGELMAQIISAMLKNPATGKGGILDAGKEIFEIRDVASKEAAVETFLGKLREAGAAEESVLARRLVVEELLVNALRHGFEGSHYDPQGFKLQESHEVSLAFSKGPATTRVEISDSAGRLTPERLRRVLGRQFSEAGLMEGSGRGLFLAFSLGNLLCLESVPGRLTRLTVCFHEALGDDVSGLLIR